MNFERITLETLMGLPAKFPLATFKRTVISEPQQLLVDVKNYSVSSHYQYQTGLVCLR